MNHKQKLNYTVLGAVIMLIGLVLGAIVATPLIAQNNGVVDEVRCSKLVVVDEAGQPAILLGSIEKDINIIALHNSAGKLAAVLHTKNHGGNLIIYNQDQKNGVLLSANKQGGSIDIYNQAEKRGVVLKATNKGNVVALLNEEEEQAISLSSLTKLGNTIDIYDEVGNISWEAP